MSLMISGFRTSCKPLVISSTFCSGVKSAILASVDALRFFKVDVLMAGWFVLRAGKVAKLRDEIWTVYTASEYVNEDYPETTSQ